MCVLGAGTMQMGTKNARILVGVCAATVFFVISVRLFATARFDPDSMTGVVRSTGICEQTTDYTCGASAAATLLHHYGIASTEAEMARLCWTNSLSGTDIFCTARGLRLKLEGSGRGVQFHSGTWEQLKARTEPAMATIKWGVLVDHWVVVFEVREDDKVLLGDPLSGLQLYSKADFMETWQRVLLTADRE
jgi:ABC-type bacteriocin/lantibiotic exporter with double-glycine peptidase domain